MLFGAAALALGSPFLVSAHKDNQKVNDCRAFNLRLSEEQRRGAQAQGSYKWFDEFSPAPELGVNAFDPVFRGAISNSPDQ